MEVTQPTMEATFLGTEQINDIIAKNLGKTYRSFNTGSLMYLLGSLNESDLLFMLRNELMMKAKVAVHLKDGKKVAGGVGYLELQGSEINDFEGKDSIEKCGYYEVRETEYAFAGLIKPGHSERLRTLDGCQTTTEERIYTSVGLTFAERNKLMEMVNERSEKVVDSFFEEAPDRARKELERIEKIPIIARQVGADIATSMTELKELEMSFPCNSPVGRTVMKQLPEHGLFIFCPTIEPLKDTKSPTMKKLGKYVAYR